MLTDAELKTLPDNPDTGIAEAGKDTLLYVNAGTTAAAKFVLVGGQRNSPLNMAADSIDGSHKNSGGWKTNLQGLKNWSMEHDGLLIMSDEGRQVMEYCYRNSKQVNIKLVYKNGSYRTGWANITKFDEDNSHTGVQTVKITLEGVGPISDITAAETTGTGA